MRPTPRIGRKLEVNPAREISRGMIIREVHSTGIRIARARPTMTRTMTRRVRNRSPVTL